MYIFKELCEIGKYQSHIHFRYIGKFVPQCPIAGLEDDDVIRYCFILYHPSSNSSSRITCSTIPSAYCGDRLYRSFRCSTPEQVSAKIQWVQIPLRQVSLRSLNKTKLCFWSLTSQKQLWSYGGNPARIGVGRPRVLNPLSTKVGGTNIVSVMFRII